MTEQERRQSPRHSLKTRVEIRTDGGVLPAEAVDIGEDGIRVTAHRPITPGTAATVIMTLAGEAFLRGPVIWTMETVVGGLPVYQMGIGADAIGMGEESAVGHAEKTRFVQTILEKSTAQNEA